MHYTCMSSTLGLPVFANLVLRESRLDGRVDFHLDLGLGLLLRRAAAAGDALRLGEALADRVGRERVKSEGLNGVDGEAVVRVDRGEAARDWVSRKHVPKKRLLVPLDSITSSRPGRRDSMLGTCEARIPRSPLTAETLTWVTSWAS